MPSRLSERHFITASVNRSQPILLWEAAMPDSTVSMELRRRTPCLAQLSRLGRPLIFIPRSSSISLNMFFRDGGAGTPSGTEKLRPIACP